MLIPPDWSTFIPDLIGAVVTGLVVGVTLFIVQRKSEARAEVERYRLQWDSLRPRVAALFWNRPDYRRSAAGAPWVPFRDIAKPILDQLEDIPTGVFAKRLGSAELEALHGYSRVGWRLKQSSSQVSSAVHEASQRYVTNAGYLDLPGDPTAVLASLVFAHIQQSPPQLAFELRPHQVAPADEAVQTIVSDSQVREAARLFETDLRTLIELHRTLEKQFEDEP